MKRLDRPSLIYYGRIYTYGEVFAKIDQFARSMSLITEDPDSPVTFLTLAHPANYFGDMAQNKRGKKNHVANPAVVRNNPKSAFGGLDPGVVVVSPTGYETARDSLAELVAEGAIKNIIYLALTEGIEDDAGEEELIADLRKMDDRYKHIPASMILRSMRKGYRSRKVKTIPGADFYNYGEYMELSDGDNSPVPSTPRPEEPTLYLNTSGTMGQPKIIPRSDNNFTVSHNAYMSVDGLDLDPETDISGSYFPPFPSTIDQFNKSSWVEGIPQDINSIVAFNGGMVQHMHDHRVTMVTASIEAARSIMTTPLEKGSMSHVRVFAVGGESEKKRYLQAWNTRAQWLGMQNRIVLSYGATEFVPGPGTNFEIISFDDYDPDQANVAGKSIGKGIARITLDGQELPRGQRGLIEINPDPDLPDDSKAFPYLGEEEKWHEGLLPDGFRRIGDVGAMDEVGRLRIDGRDSDRIIDGEGKAHYRFLIENVASESPNAIGAVTVELSYPIEGATGAVVSSFIQMDPEHKDETEATLRDLIARAEDKLEPGARPLAYCFIDKFPTSDTFKTDRKALARQRKGFYTIEDDQLIRIGFSKDGKMSKKPASGIKTTKI